MIDITEPTIGGKSTLTISQAALMQTVLYCSTLERREVRDVCLPRKARTLGESRVCNSLLGYWCCDDLAGGAISKRCSVIENMDLEEPHCYIWKLSTSSSLVLNGEIIIVPGTSTYDWFYRWPMGDSQMT